MVNEKKVVLWCQRCQRGVSGVIGADKMKPGDDCPLCYEKEAGRGRFADFSNVNKLQDAEEVKADIARRVELENMNKKVIRGQETTGEIRKKISKEFNDKFDAQEQQIKELTSMIKKLSK